MDTTFSAKGNQKIVRRIERDKKIVFPSNSPWASPIVFVVKKDSPLVDYHEAT